MKTRMLSTLSLAWLGLLLGAPNAFAEGYRGVAAGSSCSEISRIEQARGARLVYDAPVGSVRSMSFSTSSDGDPGVIAYRCGKRGTRRFFRFSAKDEASAREVAERQQAVVERDLGVGDGDSLGSALAPCWQEQLGLPAESGDTAMQGAWARDGQAAAVYRQRIAGAGDVWVIGVVVMDLSADACSGTP